MLWVFSNVVICFHLYFLLSSHSAAGGEIFNQCVADNDEAFTEKDVIRLAKQILTGVAFLHRNNVVHLDLKVSTFCTFAKLEVSTSNGHIIRSRWKIS